MSKCPEGAGDLLYTRWSKGLSEEVILKLKDRKESIGKMVYYPPSHMSHPSKFALKDSKYLLLVSVSPNRL